VLSRAPQTPKPEAVFLSPAQSQRQYYRASRPKTFFTSRARVCIVWHMKLSIKNIICDIKTINNTMYISDADCNRVLYPKIKTASRGKTMSKEKLVDLERGSMVKIGGVMFYPLDTRHIDKCFGNDKLLATLK